MLLNKKTNDYFLFTLGNEVFALSANTVIALIDESHTSLSKHSLKYFIGHHPYDNKQVPIIDIKQKINPRRSFFDNSNTILIAEVEFENSIFPIGFFIDQTLEILSLDHHPIISNPRKNSGFIQGYFRYMDNFITVLDLNKLMHLDELNVILSHDNLCMTKQLESFAVVYEI